MSLGQSDLAICFNPIFPILHPSNSFILSITYDDCLQILHFWFTQYFCTFATQIVFTFITNYLLMFKYFSMLVLWQFGMFRIPFALMLLFSYLFNIVRKLNVWSLVHCYFFHIKSAPISPILVLPMSNFEYLNTKPKC